MPDAGLNNAMDMQVAVLECAVSLAVFPGVTSAICSQYNEASVAPCHPHSRFGRFYGPAFTCKITDDVFLVQPRCSSLP